MNTKVEVGSNKKSVLGAWAKFFFKFLFSFGIIAYMIFTGRLDLQTVKNGLMNPTVVIASLVLIVSGTVIGIFRWKLLLEGQGISMSYLQVLRYGLIGTFFNTTMPGAVSGDVVKAWYVIADRPAGQKKTPILTSIVIDRIIGLFGLITVSMISMLMNWSLVWDNARLHSIALANLFMGITVGIFFLYVSLSNWGPFALLREKMTSFKGNKVGDVFLKAYDAWASYRDQPLKLWGSLVCALVTHSCVVLAILFCARALGEDHMRIYQIFLLAPIGLLTIALPIAPAGLGVGHVAFNALFLMVGSKLGAEIFTLFVTLQILINLVGVVFYLRSQRPLSPAAALSASASH